MSNTTLKLVLVNTDGGKVGQVKYTAPNGMIGVALMNEHGRVDEWHPSQVSPLTSKEAAQIAVKQFPVKRKLA